jgi:dihydroorotate dehydrogenase electron transfer subunit
MKAIQAKVVERELLAPDVVSVWLGTGLKARATRPGQFLQVRVNSSFEPFLRRPLSVAQQKGDELRLVFRVVGPGTAELARTKAGDTWDIIGPLGKPAPTLRDRMVILIGGGIGIAPLLFLAERLAATNQLAVLLGARTRAEVILRSEFQRLPAELRLATEDGSLGTKGLVTDLLPEVLKDTAPNTVIFACGPRPMLRQVKTLTGRRPEPGPGGFSAYAFWEERLGCGTGICYGCAVKRADGQGYIRFCQDGPVLRLDEIEV